jgi:hypothetical protein
MEQQHSAAGFEDTGPEEMAGRQECLPAGETALAGWQCRVCIGWIGHDCTYLGERFKADGSATALLSTAPVSGPFAGPALSPEAAVWRLCRNRGVMVL